MGMGLQGCVTVPGDKSISHRSLMFASLCRGTGRITGLLDSADVQATRSCLEALGARIVQDGGETRVTGIARFQEPADILNAQNSGTTIRLMTGLLAPQPFYSVFTGDASLRKRPMGRVVHPLRTMGAEIFGRSGTKPGEVYAPLTLLPCRKPLQGMTYPMPMASAQVKSALLLAGLSAEGETVLEQPAPSRDHTERMLRALGIALTETGHRIHLPGGQFERFQAVASPDWVVPGDFSSAAFLMVAALLTPDSCIRIENVGLNPQRVGLMTALQGVGAKISVEARREVCGEPVGDLVVETSTLKGDIHLTEQEIPALIDEIPILAVAGACLEGTLTVTGAEELRAKESDRIATVAEEFGKLGIPLTVFPDGFALTGTPGRRIPTPVTPLEAHHDHRIAMALAVLNLLTGAEPWPLNGAEWVSVSFPDFYPAIRRLMTRPNALHLPG